MRNHIRQILREHHPTSAVLYRGQYSNVQRLKAACWVTPSLAYATGFGSHIVCYRVREEARLFDLNKEADFKMLLHLKGEIINPVTDFGEEHISSYEQYVGTSASEGNNSAIAEQYIKEIASLGFDGVWAFDGGTKALMVIHPEVFLSCPCD